jgi:hypothetical protein
MSGDESAEEDRRQLYEAVKAHAANLEIARSVSSSSDLEAALDRRIAETRRLLEWLAQALEPHPSAFPEARTRSPSTAQADQDQIPQSARDPPKTPK